MAMLENIDKFGVMTKQQIMYFVPIQWRNLIPALKALEKLELINNTVVNHKTVHYITNKGSRFIGMINNGYVKSDDKEPYFNTLIHDLKIVNCVIQESEVFFKKYGVDFSLEIISEREILAEKFLELDFSQKSRSHITKLKRDEGKKIPDFLIRFPLDGNYLTNAYEVELTRKSKKALRAKLSWLTHQVVIGQYNYIVYFFENDSVRTFVETTVAQVHGKIISKTIEENTTYGI